jgi:hypothetical protein
MIAPLLDKIRMVPLSPPCRPEHIPPHAKVLIDGDWVDFDGYQSETGLMFLSNGSAGWTRRPGEDDLYSWCGA